MFDVFFHSVYLMWCCILPFRSPLVERFPRPGPALQRVLQRAGWPPSHRPRRRRLPYAWPWQHRRPRSYLFLPGMIHKTYNLTPVEIKNTHTSYSDIISRMIKSSVITTTLWKRGIQKRSTRTSQVSLIIWMLLWSVPKESVGTTQSCSLRVTYATRK